MLNRQNAPHVIMDNSILHNQNPLAGCLGSKARSITVPGACVGRILAILSRQGFLLRVLRTIRTQIWQHRTGCDITKRRASAGWRAAALLCVGGVRPAASEAGGGAGVGCLDSVERVLREDGVEGAGLRGSANLWQADEPAPGEKEESLAYPFSYYHCAFFPLDRALGLEGDGRHPGDADPMRRAATNLFFLDSLPWRSMRRFPANSSISKTTPWNHGCILRRDRQPIEVDGKGNHLHGRGAGPGDRRGTEGLRAARSCLIDRMLPPGSRVPSDFPCPVAPRPARRRRTRRHLGGAEWTCEESEAGRSPSCSTCSMPSNTPAMRLVLAIKADLEAGRVAKVIRT